MDDLISRQAAIDIERNATVDTNPSHFEAHQKFTQFMEDAEVSSFGRWQWSNGFNTALTAVGIDLKKLPSAQSEQSSEIQDILDYLDTVLHPIISPEHWNVYSELHDMISTLPSAQSEIIRCRDCKEYYAHDHRCRWWNHGTNEAGWCYGAERREE